MSARHKLRRLREFLGRQQALAIHPPALPQLFESVRSGDPNPWASFSAQYGDENTNQRRMMVGSVAVLPIVGFLVQKPSWLTRMGYGTSTEELESELKACLGDSRVKSIVFYGDSPGGTAIGNEELWQAIFAARSGKPVHGYVRGLCASACYYLLSGCRKISASPSSVVGSIGTISIQVEYSKWLAEAGITPTVITHGENKGAGNPFEPLGAKAKATLQKTVNDFGEMFVAAVARGRGVSPETVMARFGQGQIFLAEEARERGLIDGVESWDALLAQLQSETPAAIPETHADQTRLPSVAASQRTPTSQPESSNVAGASAAVPSPVPPAAATLQQGDARTKEAPPVNKKIKAALFARGLIGDIEASDDVCRGVLAGWFAGQAKDVPKEEAEVLSALNGTAPQAAAAVAAPVAPAQAANPAQAAHDREVAEARAEGARNATQRITDLKARGALLNMSDADIDAAIASGKPTAEIVTQWTDKLCTQERPIEPPASSGAVRVTEPGAQLFQQNAVTGLLLQMNKTVDPKQVNDETRRFGRMPLSVIALQSLKLASQRIEDEYNKELVFEQALAMDGPGRFGISAESGGAFNRPGSFPNLLSNLANKIMDEGLELSDPSYPQWAGRWAGDLPDFKPAPIINKSQHDEMDEVLDAEAFKEFGLAEELLSYLQLARFGNAFEWTPVMMANDDLNAFDEGLLGLASAHENTLNRLCLRLLTGNVTLLDTFALFDNTNHGNDIAAGGVPSTAQWKSMQNKFYAQRGVGGTGRLRGRLDLVLAPPTLELDVNQTFVTHSVEIKHPATDTTINPYRGTVKVVYETDLQDDSTAKWYGLRKPQGTRNATVVYCYFRGWGKNGRRERWYDPKTKTWNVSLEGRFGAAAKQYRTAVRNAGA